MHFEFRYDENKLLLDDWVIYLAGQEADFIKIFEEANWRPLTHDYIIRRMWGQAETEHAISSLRNCVSCLRRNLEGTPMRLVTIWGKGYQLVPPVSEQPEPEIHPEYRMPVAPMYENQVAA